MIFFRRGHEKGESSNSQVIRGDRKNCAIRIRNLRAENCCTKGRDAIHNSYLFFGFIFSPGFYRTKKTRSNIKRAKSEGPQDFTIPATTLRYVCRPTKVQHVHRKVCAGMKQPPLRLSHPCADRPEVLRRRAIDIRMNERCQDSRRFGLGRPMGRRLHPLPARKSRSLCCAQYRRRHTTRCVWTGCNSCRS